MPKGTLTRAKRIITICFIIRKLLKTKREGFFGKERGIRKKTRVIHRLAWNDHRVTAHGAQTDTSQGVTKVSQTFGLGMSVADVVVLENLHRFITRRVVRGPLHPAEDGGFQLFPIPLIPVDLGDAHQRLTDFGDVIVRVGDERVGLDGLVGFLEEKIQVAHANHRFSGAGVIRVVVGHALVDGNGRDIVPRDFFLRHRLVEVVHGGGKDDGSGEEDDNG